MQEKVMPVAMAAADVEMPTVRGVVVRLLPGGPGTGEFPHSGDGVRRYRLWRRTYFRRD